MANELVQQVTEIINAPANLPDGYSEAQTPVLPVKKPRKPRRELPVIDLSSYDPQTIAASDISDISKSLEDFKKLEMVPPDVEQQIAQLHQYVGNAWQEAQSWLAAADELLATGDSQKAYELRQAAGTLWSNVQNERAQLHHFMQTVQQANAMLQVARVQQQLLDRHPWLHSKRAWNDAVNWAVDNYGLTVEQINGVTDPEAIDAACYEYEEHCKKQYKALPTESGRKKLRDAALMAHAEKRRAAGPVSVAEQARMVSELLNG